MIVLVVGPDAAAARAEVARTVAAHDPDGTNTSRFDGREVPLSEIGAAVGSVGFFGAARVVVVRGLLARAARTRAANGDGDDAAATSSAAGAVDLAPLLAGVPAQNILVLADPELTAVPAAVKRAAPANARIAGFEPPRGQALVAWLRRVARDAGGELEADAARVLAKTLYPQTWSSRPSNPRYDRPPDTDLLRHEVEKLVLAAEPGPVRRQHVVELTPGVVDDRVFRFLEAADSGRLGEALPELAKLLRAGEEPAKLTAQLAQQVELAAVLDAAPGRDPVAIGRDLGLSNPARMSGIASGRRRPDGRPGSAVGTAVAADRGLKQGRLRRPEDGLYALVLGLAPGRSRDEGGT